MAKFGANGADGVAKWGRHAGLPLQYPQKMPEIRKNQKKLANPANLFYIPNMETISVGELKTSFSEVLKVVRNGRRVGVLYGNSKKPVVMIIPFTESENNISSYEVGKKYFGKYGSGNGHLSQDYKKKLKQKLYGKYRSR